MPRALLPAITLYIAASVSAFAQSRYRESPEPPLADGSIQQTAGQQLAQPLAPMAQDYPVVAIDVVAPQYVPHGKDIEYKLRVANVANVAALGVTALYQLPKGGTLVRSDPPATNEAGLLSWSIGSLAGGARKEISLIVTPGPDMTEWTHVAKVRFEHGRQGKTKIARPEVTVKVVGPSAAQQHDVVPLRLEVANPGVMEVRELQVVDVLPEGLVHQNESASPSQQLDGKNTKQLRTWTIPRLGPGETRFLDFRVAAERMGEHTHRVSVSSASGAKHEADAKLAVQPPKLELKVEGPAKRGSHQTATYRIALRNAGNAPLGNVTVSDKFPDGCDIISASEGAQTFEREIQWILPQLQPNESRMLEITTKSKGAGRIQHQFAVSYRGQREVKELATDFEPIAALNMEIRGEPQAVAVGDTVRITVAIRNAGSASSTNVRPALVLPSSLSYVSAEPATHQNTGGRVSFDAMTIPDSGQTVLTVIAKATRPALPAVLAAELTADQLESGKLRREESVAISDPRPGRP